MPSQFPAFRHSVAQQMANYKERTAQRIRAEAAKHGESPADLAHALRIHPSTPERWFRAERMPQPRLRKQLASHWELPLDEFEPDAEIEDREVRDQLDRIEREIKKNSDKLDEILKRLPQKKEGGDGGLPGPPPLDPSPRPSAPSEGAPPSEEEERRQPDE